MIWLEELQTRKKVSKIFNRYERTFPENERRSKEQFLALAENPDAFVFMINHENEIIGYAVIWEFEKFHFLEHFEIFEEYQNQKLGSATLETMKEKFGKIILETEPETLSEIAQKRIHFYERNEFSVIKKDYIQPSYGEGKTSLMLFLLANYTPENIEVEIQNIHETVYGQK